MESSRPSHVSDTVFSALNALGYEPGALLGRGATADVIRALRIADGTAVALKILRPGTTDAAGLKRLQAEAQAASQLGHPGVVRCLGRLDAAGCPVLVLELVEGTTLEVFQQRLPFVLPEVAALILAEVLDALSSAHAAGIVHRDLKPTNILVTTEGAIKVTDFGLAKIEGASAATVAGSVLGSPDFMSPEQACGDVVTPRSDVFSATSLLYFLVTGTKPFHRDSTLATIAAVARAQCEPAPRRNPKISAPLARVIAQGMAAEPSARFADAAAFKQSLVGYLRDTGVLRAGEAPAQVLTRWTASPVAETMSLLKRIAERLVVSGEEQAHAGRRDEALMTIAHLSLVAPDSMHVERLIALADESPRSHRKTFWFWRAGVALGAIALLVVVFVGGTRLMQLRLPPDAPMVETKTAAPMAPVHPVSAQPTEKISAIAKPVAVASEMGAVVFDLGPGIQTLWNGQRVTRKARFSAPAGDYKLVMGKEGFKPMIRTIRVSAGESTVIRVK